MNIKLKRFAELDKSNYYPKWLSNGNGEPTLLDHCYIRCRHFITKGPQTLFRQSYFI